MLTHTFIHTEPLPRMDRWKVAHAHKRTQTIHKHDYRSLRLKHDPAAPNGPRRAPRDRCLVKGEGWETEPSVEGSRWFGFRSQGCRTGRGSSAAPETRSSTAPGTRGWEPRHGHCSHGGWCIMLNVCAVKLHFENWRSDVDLIGADGKIQMTSFLSTLTGSRVSSVDVLPCWEPRVEAYRPGTGCWALGGAAPAGQCECREG